MNEERERAAARLDERGMTLIEVVVAIAILAVLATAALGVYLAGVNSSSALQRREVAVTVASQVLEKANAVLPTTLYSGRSAADVETIRTRNAAIDGVSETYRISDTVVPIPSTASLPVSTVTTLGGTRYTVDTVVGTCFQPKAGGACTAPGYPTQPATAPANTMMLSRITKGRLPVAGSTFTCTNT